MWCVAAVVVLLATTSSCQGFAVGIKSTKCNLDPSKGEINDPCDSLYGAECRGSHCACPAGTFEDKALTRCSRTRPQNSQGGGGGGGGAVEDLGLPFDFEPNKPAPAPPPPKPKEPQPGYNPNQPGYNPNQPGYNPNQPGYNPNQPGYNPNQPGYNPNQPGYNPNQPGYNPNQPGYNPNQPGTYDKTKGKKGDNIGEEVGGGVGGIVMLLIMGGLIYFCCRGGKHKQVMNRFQGLPFMNRGQQAAAGGAVPMQSAMVQQDMNFASQHTYVAPDAQQPQPDPAGYPAPAQQPPPYTQQYQPTAPLPQ